MAERVDLVGGRRTPIALTPSSARHLDHGFASFARFFPEAKSLLARFEERLWQELYAVEDGVEPIVFDDQYICSGGQLYERLAGHDRMLGDLRPLALAKLGRSSDLVCHPYDICTLLILEEAGCPVSDPHGRPLDATLDTTTPIAWIGFANRALADAIWPALARVLEEFFGAEQDGRR